MKFDSFGKIYRLTDWGDTHGDSLKGLIEGCPAGLWVDMDFIAAELNRRAPSDDALSTKRKETDCVEFLSGITDGVTTGESIRFRIPNKDVKVSEANRYVLKPSHASYTYMRKYGATDNEQCGRASARQTVCRVVAGAIAKLWLRDRGVRITSKVVNIATPAREGDSVGALVEGRISGLPAGLGEPIYDKFSARLAYAMLSINAAKGFEYGLGFKAAEMSGSDYHDVQNPDFSFRTNHDGGIQGGITNGEEVYFRVAFKPIPSVRYNRETIDFEGNKTIMRGSDRNDLCVVPRVLPVVEAMAAMVVMDFYCGNIAENAENMRNPC
ncbi:MAG: chorismate synthase [Bacteroidales bacterium]|nr:chorismate synthase [Bacteroidales bacterium]